MYIFVSEVRLEEEEYKNYLKITPECLDELFVPVTDDITKKKLQLWGMQAQANQSTAQKMKFFIKDFS